MKKHPPVTMRAYQASGFYDEIKTDFTDFQAYIAHCRAGILAARLDLTAKTREKIVNANCPFELCEEANPRKGILLLHGLYDSPCVMLNIAQYFAQRGFLVRSLLMPGHGTVPGDLLKVCYQDWLAWGQFGLKTLFDEVDEVYLGGFSTGGAVASYLALQQPARFKKLFLFSPAFKLTTTLSYVAHFHRRISWLLPAPHWLCLMDEIDYAKYRSFTVNSLCQIDMLGAKIRQHVAEKKIPFPTFWVTTQHDEVLSTKTLLEIFLKASTSDSQLIYYSPKQFLCDDARVAWRSSQLLSDNIVDMSHVALPIAPTHFHYGKTGDFQRLVNETLAKKNKTPLYYGSLKNINLMSRASLARLTYNFDFSHLTHQMDQFLR